MPMVYKFVSRERERLLGILFGLALIASCLYGLLAENFPTAAKVITALCGLAFALLLLRAGIRYFRKPAPALVGSLSSDERIKARSKLKPPLSPPPGPFFRP